MSTPTDPASDLNVRGRGTRTTRACDASSRMSPRQRVTPRPFTAPTPRPRPGIEERGRGDRRAGATTADITCGTTACPARSVPYTTVADPVVEHPRRQRHPADDAERPPGDCAVDAMMPTVPADAHRPPARPLESRCAAPPDPRAKLDHVSIAWLRAGDARATGCHTTRQRRLSEPICPHGPVGPASRSRH